MNLIRSDTYVEVRKFYRTQREIASVINEVIDNYWANNICDHELEKIILFLCEFNIEKIIKDEGFTTVLRQQCGKKRLEVFSKIIGRG